MGKSYVNRLLYYETSNYCQSIKFPLRLYLMKVQFYFLYYTIYLISLIQCDNFDDENVALARDDSISCINGNNNNLCEEGGGGGSHNSAEASNIALKAAQEAKAAEDAQQQAGQQAAHQVKEQLADKAVEAAKAAEAALAGKEALVEQLREEIKEAELVVSEETSSLQHFTQTVQAATKASQEAKAVIKLMKTILQIAEQNAVNTAQAAEGIQAQMTEKEQLLDAAKNRLEQLTKQLHAAKQDLSKTKEAAKKAEIAASEAKQNAMRNRRRIGKRHTNN